MKPHRLFFPLALVYAALAIPLWTWFERPLPGLGLWHVHEMVFGYSLAVIAGFLLTRDRSPALVTLALFWIAARATYITPELIGPLTRGAVSLTSTGVFAALAGRTFLRGVKRVKNGLFPIVMGGFFLSELIFQLGEWRYLAHGSRLGAYLSLGLVLTLIVTMGGRIAMAAISGAWQKSGGERFPSTPFGEPIIAVSILTGFTAYGSSVSTWLAAVPLGLAGGLLIFRLLPRLVRLNAIMPLNRRLKLFPMSLRLVALTQSVIGIALVLSGLALVCEAPGNTITDLLHIALIPGIGVSTLAMILRTDGQRSGKAEHVRPLVTAALLIAATALLRGGFGMLPASLISPTTADLRLTAIATASLTWVAAVLIILWAILSPNPDPNRRTPTTNDGSLP